MDATPEHSLAALGFTELETRIYVALLKRSPQTGYALSKALGKAAANIYQALAALALKGAVLLEEAGGSRSASAIPPDELLERLERRFKASRSAAAEALNTVHVRTAQDRLYQIQDVEQFYGRAEALVDRATEVVLFDLFPEPLRRLDTALRRACARGVRVAGVIYAPTAAPYQTASPPHPQLALDRWPGWQATLAADASEFVLGLIGRDGRRVLHGLWSDSIYLSCMQHNGLAAEIAAGALAERNDTATQDAISLLKTMPPGLRQLIGPATDGESP